MLGYAAIFLALIATGCSAVFYLKAALASTVKDTSGSEKKGSLFYGIAAYMILLAAGDLYYLILSDNFRYGYVFSYSSLEQALVYKISAFWAGQEGSFLLWTVFHAVFGLMLIKKKAPAALVTQCGLQLFLLVALVVKSPFKAFPSMQPDGMGLNPLLQDPWMVIHPPLLFLGYAALAVPFAWTIHGLLTGRHKAAVAQALPWTLFAWACLGAGIFIGGFWAYKVLGWGGYWAWDPVENSSLVPWLFTGVLLHLLRLSRVRETALPATYFVAIINFVLVLYGTYLTRSGVLSDFSTHSFEGDGGGGLLASFVLITAVSGLIIWSVRRPSLPDGPLFATVKSREFSLFAAAMLLAAIGVIVFVGMSTPLITMLMGSPKSVGISFYNAACLPLTAVMMMMLTASSLPTWSDSHGHFCRRRRRWWLLALALAAMALAAATGVNSFFAATTVGLAVAAIGATALAIQSKTLSMPAGLTHAGMAAAMIGIVFSSVASHSIIASFEAGQRQEILGSVISYLGKQADTSGKGFYQQFTLGDPPVAMLLPFTKNNPLGGPSIHEPGIYRGLTADVYLAPITQQESGKTPKLNLHKGEEAATEGIGVKFIRFGMEDSGGSDIKAYALLEITKDGTAQVVKPEIVPRDSQMIFVPAQAFNRYEISLTSFSVDEGQVGITVRDLITPPKPETIEAEISRKPLINLVWLGVILVTFGTAWAALKRSRSAFAQDSECKPLPTVPQSRKHVDYEAKNIVSKELPLKDMHCSSCESRIENALRKLPGIKHAKASYTGNKVYIEYDPNHCPSGTINRIIQQAGYTISENTSSIDKINSIIGILVVFLAVLLLGKYSGGFDMSAKLRGKVTYFVLFAIGLFTSLHCVGMCGGIALSQSLAAKNAGKLAAFSPSLSYNIGRVLSYTVLGGVIGALGSVLSVSIGFMSGVTIFAGIFMICMGLNMAGFNLFREYLKIPLPSYSLPQKANTPFWIGVFNGLMPCGPLQTMQLYALGTGSAFNGAAAMFVFALGTLPLMLSFGTLTSLFSKDSTKRILKLSSALVIVLGLIMTTRGLAIAGINLPFAHWTTRSATGTALVTKAQLSDGVQTVRVSANNSGYTPNILYVQKGVPVKWIIDGEQINSCNNEIVVPSLNIKKKLSSGENIIEITPQDQDISFSCWMGMIKGVIKVVDDVNAVDVTKDNTVIASESGCCNTEENSACCAAKPESIYGNDISNIPTERMIHKATINNNLQTIMLKGTGYELEPLVVVVEKHTPAKLAFDLTNFANAAGDWHLVDYPQQKTIASFTGRQGVVEVDFDQADASTFTIYKDDKITGVIEVVDELDATDLEKVRAKFF